MRLVARAFAIVFLNVATAAEVRAGGQLRALTEYVSMGEGALEDCPADTMRLRVLRGAKQLLAQEYCSAYGIGDAKLVTDAHARDFVLLNYAEGKGTRATTKYLQVYELVGDNLYDRGRLLRSVPIGRFADMVCDYSVEIPSHGGLRIVGRSRIEGKRDADDLTPRQQQTILVVN